MKPLVIQFSGGRTSAFMAKFLFEFYPDREKHVLFENTGKEDPRTLEFILECDREWDLKVQWLEAVVHHGQHKGSTHKIVDFESASRKGEPFLEVIKKYGLPTHSHKHCTRELKINPAKSYLKSIGLKDYEIAIGIRADEQHRIKRESAAKQSIIYPLVDLIKVNEKIVLNFWSRQTFDLKLKSYEGNCNFCFEKSLNSLVNLTREKPDELTWWEEIGDKYATTGAKAEQYPRQMYRGYRTATDIRELAAAPTLYHNNPEFEQAFDCVCRNT